MSSTESSALAWTCIHSSRVMPRRIKAMTNGAGRSGSAICNSILSSKKYSSKLQDRCFCLDPTLYSLGLKWNLGTMHSKDRMHGQWYLPLWCISVKYNRKFFTQPLSWFYVLFSQAYSQNLLEIWQRSTHHRNSPVAQASYTFCMSPPPPYSTVPWYASGVLTGGHASVASLSLWLTLLLPLKFEQVMLPEQKAAVSDCKNPPFHAHSVPRDELCRS